jgi:hypothetical protein
VTHRMATQIAATVGRLDLLMTLGPEEIGRRIKGSCNRKSPPGRTRKSAGGDRVAET